MSRVFIISDLHLSHAKMAERRGFKTVEEHDSLIIESWNSVVYKKDTVWVLGDLTMENPKASSKLEELQVTINVVLGNHDLPQHTNILANYVNKIAGCVKYKDCIFTHIPIHPMEFHKFKYNIHGHIHDSFIYKQYERGNDIKDERYINVCCEVVDYTPQLFTNLI